MGGGWDEYWDGLACWGGQERRNPRRDISKTHDRQNSQISMLNVCMSTSIIAAVASIFDTQSKRKGISKGDLSRVCQVLPAYLVLVEMVLGNIMRAVLQILLVCDTKLVACVLVL
ncbi:uncharacterized protein LY79DRAFT_183367 [Colletotrichum navitas]|uniref:Uncharacterized protein n=1 Tax=Colletotrichum navitas TaxID=681940 RepID=A0AAD8Q0L8_9PEZI|nr:uncharacterized protein LY79DRAFT_183367 [Colletotrichum navitas]KAK1593289.1 hypothetical protein LY79DRAFT_183367 [Colletotrichum navitas]